MSIDHNSPAFYAQRAHAHAQILSRNPRGSATQAEKQAADYTLAELISMGVDEAKLETFLGLRSLWLFLALAFGLALVGHASYWLLRGPAGGIPAMLIALLAFGSSGFLLWRKFTFRSYPLRIYLPHAPSQNVISIVSPAGEVRRRVVLVGHLDSHRAVFWFASNALLAGFAFLSVVAIYGVFLSPFLYLLATITHVQLFAWIGFGLAVLHFLGWFTGVTADLGRYSPGANDNASGVGTILALTEHLKKQPLRNTELWLAFTGCEESGCDGLLSLIKEHSSMLKEATFIDFEMVGIGDGLRYIYEEGYLRRRHIPKELETILQEVGIPFGLQSASTPRVGAFTESGALWEHGFKAVCLSAYSRNSVFLPEWHRLTDTPDHLQLNALERIHSLAWALLQRLDQG